MVVVYYIVICSVIAQTCLLWFWKYLTSKSKVEKILPRIFLLKAGKISFLWLPPLPRRNYLRVLLGWENPDATSKEHFSFLVGLSDPSMVTEKKYSFPISIFLFSIWRKLHYSSSSVLSLTPFRFLLLGQ